MAKSKTTAKKNSSTKDKKYQAKLTRALGLSIGLLSVAPLLAVINFIIPGGVFNISYFRAESYDGPESPWIMFAAITFLAVVIGLAIGATVFVKGQSGYEKLSPLNKRLYFTLMGIAVFVLGYFAFNFMYSY